MDKIAIKFDDGREYILPDISEELFEKYIPYTGFSDVDYRTYMRERNMHDISSFNDSIKTTTLIVTSEEGRVLKFKCISDSDYDD